MPPGSVPPGVTPPAPRARRARARARAVARTAGETEEGFASPPTPTKRTAPRLAGSRRTTTAPRRAAARARAARPRRDSRWIRRRNTARRSAPPAPRSKTRRARARCPSARTAEEGARVAPPRTAHRPPARSRTRPARRRARHEALTTSARVASSPPRVRVEGVEWREWREAEETRERATETHEDARGSCLCVIETRCAFVPNGTPARFVFFRGSAFGVSRKKNLQRSPIPRAFRFGNCSASVQGLILSQTPPKSEIGKHYPPTVAGALPEPSNRDPSHCHSLAARGSCTVPSYP